MGALNYIESISFALSVAQSAEDFADIEKEIEQSYPTKRAAVKKGKKQEEPSSPRTFVVDGFTIKAGKNNLQNDRLLREADGEDIWLHTQKYHSSHVVIFTKGKVATDKAIEVAAEICAYYSQGSGGGKIPVDYCPKKRVKKPPQARLGKVIYSEYQTVLVEGNPHTEAEVSP